MLDSRVDAVDMTSDSTTAREIQSVPQAPARPSTFQVLAASSQLRVWILRSALSLLDQGLTSSAGFVMNLLLARWMAPADYGAFAISFTLFLFACGFHNVLLLEPLSVMGPSYSGRTLQVYFRAQIRIHALLVGTLSALVILLGLFFYIYIPGSPLVGAAFGSGLTLPLLLLPWMTRRMCYVVRRPSIAVLGSAIYLSMTMAGVFVLKQFGEITCFRSFLVMGIASLVSARVVLHKLDLTSRRITLSSDLNWHTVVSENWRYGRWLVGSTALFSVFSQAQIFLVGAVLGLGAAGVLRAMQLPSLVMTQIVTAAGLLILPVYSHDLLSGSLDKVRHKVVLVTAGLGGLTLLYVALLMLLAGRIETLFFAHKYSSYVWLIPLFALVPVCGGLSIGAAMALRASRKPQVDLIANAVAAPIGLLSALCFTRWWGVAGAAGSLILSFMVYACVNIAAYRRFLVRHSEGERILATTAILNDRTGML